MIDKIPATVMILTYNSEQVLSECLASVSAFAEVLVMDGGSTDQTLAIARSFGARIEAQSETPGPITDFTAVRHRAFQLARHDWIFWIDSDERADETLINSIRVFVAKDDALCAAKVEAFPVVDGRIIRYAYFSPLFYVRLVNRRTAAWDQTKKVHEHVIFSSGVQVEALQGALLMPWPAVDVYRQKDRKYIAMAFTKQKPPYREFWAPIRSFIKNSLIALRIVGAAVYLSLRYGKTGAVLPWPYHWRFARYHLMIARERIRQFVLGSQYVPPAA